MARTKDFDESEVLNKAMNLFWLKGYNATSMQDLVDGLGISRSSLYDTYGDKHSLFIKALETYQSTNSVKICNIINNAKSGRQAIEHMLAFIAGNLLSDQSHKGCFLVNAEVEVAPHDEQVSRMVCQNDQQIEEIFYDIIKKGQQSGEISNKQDARALARFTFNTVKGMRVTAKSTQDKTVFDDIIRMALLVLE